MIRYFLLLESINISSTSSFISKEESHGSVFWSEQYFLDFVYGTTTTIIDKRVKIIKILRKIIFSITKIDMDAPLPDNALLDPQVANDMWGEKNEASADGTNSTEE